MDDAEALALAAAAKRKRAERTPDGRSVAPGTTREQAERIPEGMVYDPNTGGYADAAAIAERMGPAQGAGATFLAGAPFVGEYADEALGAAYGAREGRSADVGTEIARESREQFQEARPGAALATEMAGGVVGSLPFAASRAGQAVDRFVRGGSKAGAVARAGAAGGAVGAAEGAAQAAGRQENVGTGAAVGGVLGSSLGLIAPAVGFGVEELASRFKRLDVRTIADEFGVSPAAARTVKEALANDDLDAATRRLTELGDDAMLADAGPATGQLLNAASATGGAALATTRDAVERRGRAIGSRLTRRLDEILGEPRGTRAAARDIADSTRAARSEAYQRAYAQPVDYSSAAGRRVEETLERVPPRTLRAAIDEANDAMREAGTRNRQIMAEIADDGSVSFREMPNVEQLDQIKRALDSIGREAVDQFGRPTAQGARARRLARDLRDATSRAVPQYRAALRTGADKTQRDAGLELGRTMLFSRTSREDVLDFMRQNPSGEARAAARQGVRGAIENTMSRVKRTITDPDTDAREAMQVVKELSSRDNMDKLRLLLGKEQAEALLTEMDRQATALALRGAVARNSDTAIRQSIQGQVRDEAQPGLVRRTAGNMGNPLDAAREITQGVAGIDPRTMNERERQIFAEIADALTRIEGQDAQRALTAVRRALDGQPLRDAEAQAISRVTAIPGFAGAYQAGQQSLSQ